MESLNRRDFRVIILYKFKRRISDSEFHEEMSNVFWGNSPSLQTIQRWYLQFRRGIFNLADEPRSRPSDAVSKVNINDVQKMIEDRRVKFKQIKQTLSIGAPAVY
jgi:hypothetical protein